jgi:hypothetical protein
LVVVRRVHATTHRFRCRARVIYPGSLRVKYVILPRPGSPSELKLSEHDFGIHSGIAREIGPVESAAQIVRHAVGDPRYLLLRTEGAGLEPTRIGLEAGIDILEDGSDTIYEPGFWIEAQVVTPADIFVSNLKSAAEAAVDAAVSAAKADVGGALVGGIKGFVKGGKAGAVKEAVAGAVAGSVRGGPRDAS